MEQFDFEVDTERYIEEWVDCYNCDGDGYTECEFCNGDGCEDCDGGYVECEWCGGNQGDYEDVDNPDYMSVINYHFLDKLDNELYKAIGSEDDFLNLIENLVCEEIKKL